MFLMRQVRLRWRFQVLRPGDSGHQVALKAEGQVVREIEQVLRGVDKYTGEAKYDRLDRG